MLAVVTKPNPYFRIGTWLEGTDAGWQKAETEQRGNKLVVTGVVGIILEKSTMAPFIMRPKKAGLDK